MMNLNSMSLPRMLLLFVCSLISFNAFAGPSTAKIEFLDLTLDNSVLYKLPGKIERLMLSNPSVATVKTLSAQEIVFTAKQLGQTDVFVRFKDKKLSDRHYLIRVNESDYVFNQITESVISLLDKLELKSKVEFEVKKIWVSEQSGIQRQIDEVGNQLDGAANLTREAQDKEISMAAQTIGSAGTSNLKAGDYLVIFSGEVESDAIKKRLQSVVSALGVSVINMVDVVGPQEVRLSVRVAEVVKGNPFSMSSGLIFRQNDVTLSSPGVNLITALSGVLAEGSVSTLNNAFNIGYADGNKFAGVLSVLEENNLARILAKPELIVQSGETADFLVGGETPIPLSQEDGRVSVEFKEFGVRLRFSPVITKDGEIKMTVAPEVSNIDETAGINTNGIVIPGFRSRKVQTTVTLAPNQSFMVGGLIQDNLSSSVSKIPLLGDIPILGALFRSTSYEKGQTELAIVVTPTLVEPMEEGEVQIPGSRLVAPSKMQSALLGKLSQVLPEGTSVLDSYKNKVGLETP